MLAFPCDCFGNQEPGDNAAVKAFVRDKYGVTFPMFAKVDAVNGEDAHPIFDWLKLQPRMGGDITWNFNKFLVARNGQVLKRYGPEWSDATLRADVEDALKAAYDEADAF